MIKMREATASDLPALAGLFREAALRTGPEYYTERQVRAWAAFADEDEAFRRFIMKAHTVIAEDATGTVGFGGLEPDGHVASLYVHPNRLREGIGTMLLSRLVDRAVTLGIKRLYAETNLLSRPLFERFGFRLVEVERVRRLDAEFERYVVERLL